MAYSEPTAADAREIAAARGCLAAFSPQRPMIVGEAVYKDMRACGHFDDLLDRVMVNVPLGTR